MMSNRPIASIDMPDPWIIKHNNRYYLTFTLGDRIEIWSSASLEDFHSPRTQKSLIWKPPPSSHWSSDLWAPELHNINDTWYIYFSAAPRHTGNPGHRTVLLRSHDSDPMNPNSWTFIGPLKGLPSDQWTIDATVFTVYHRPGNPTLYCCYSGWPLGDQSDTQQDLFVVQLSAPDTAIPHTLTCISRATLDWERPDNGRRGVNEGPTFVEIPPSGFLPGGFVGIVYSAHGSWTSNYKMGLLTLIDLRNPCSEGSWEKRKAPLLMSDEALGPPFGPGHASWVRVKEHDAEAGMYCVYHATERVDDGWNNRKARVLWIGPGAFHPRAKSVCCAGAGVGCDTLGEPFVEGRHQFAAGCLGEFDGSNGDAAGTALTGKTNRLFERTVPGRYERHTSKFKKFFT